MYIAHFTVANWVYLATGTKLGKWIFATVKPRFTSAKIKIQYNYLISNAILNIKMYSCISLGLQITQSKILCNVVDDLGT